MVDDLVAQGVAPERLVAKGYGEARAEGDGEQERAEDRRVQFAILEQE